MADNNAFSIDRYDLGTNSSIGLSRSEVSNTLRLSQFSSTPTCFLCGNTATHKLIPKSSRYASAEIQDKGFVCGHCLQTNKNIDPKHYGIRPLNE